MNIIQSVEMLEKSGEEERPASKTPEPSSIQNHLRRGLPRVYFLMPSALYPAGEDGIENGSLSL